VNNGAGRFTVTSGTADFTLHTPDICVNSLIRASICACRSIQGGFRFLGECRVLRSRAVFPRLPRSVMDVARPGHGALLESALGSVVGGSLKTRPRVRERRCLTGVCIGSARLRRSLRRSLRPASSTDGNATARRELRRWTTQTFLANANDRLLGTFAERQERRRLPR